MAPITVVMMGITFQAYSVSGARFDELAADPDAALAFVQQYYSQDLVGEDFETVRLDKTAMGILEAFGALRGEMDDSMMWLAGGSTALLVGGTAIPAVRAEDVPAAAEAIGSVTDDAFAARVAENEVDTDLEFLMWGFRTLRDLVVRAAGQQRALILFISP